MFCALTRLVCRRVYGYHSSPADEEVRACRRAISLPSLVSENVNMPYKAKKAANAAAPCKALQ